MNHRKLSLIGIIGDIHAENILLEKSLGFLKSHQVEIIVCVGDIVDGFGDVNRCCEILQQEGILVVLGNHDRWLLNGDMRHLKDATQLNSLSSHSLFFLNSLPSTHNIFTSKGLALLCHGLGSNDMACLTPWDYGYAIEANTDLQKLIYENKYRYVFNGHTHQKMVRQFNKLTIINAGTLKQDNNPGFMLVNLFKNCIFDYQFTKEYTIEMLETITL